MTYDYDWIVVGSGFGGSVSALRLAEKGYSVANEAAEWLAKRTGGIAQSSVMEAALNIPTTAHILGGAAIGHGPEDGVVDSRQRVFGYENLMVCDGAAIPANVGVNPSLTITALAEHAMSQVPAKEGTEPRPLPEAARPAVMSL